MKTMYGHPLVVLINHNGKMLDVSEAVVDSSTGDPAISRDRFLNIVAREEQREDYAYRYSTLQR